LISLELQKEEDVSWKVRRAAAKCLESVISSRQDSFYRVISPALIARYRGV
jgi:cullin-associated NEDD8-dissociated protein 1